MIHTVNKSKGVILAGGPSKGTRFRPLSLWLPKALFPLAGIPMIGHHIDALSRVPNLVEIVILGLYDPEVFSEYIEEKIATMNIKIPIRYLKEPGALGTAGGLLHFKDIIMHDGPDYIYFLHVDICSPFPLIGLLEAHRCNGSNAICTIMGNQLSDRLSSLQYGCIVRSSKENKVIHYVEKPDTFVSDLINCGVYIFTANKIMEMLEERLTNRAPIEADPDDLILDKRSNYQRPRSNSLVKLVKENHLSLEQDVLVPLSEQGSLFVYETLNFWHQIKTSESTIVANGLYLNHYAQVARLEDSQLGISKTLSSLSLSKESLEISERNSSIYVHSTAKIDPTAKIGPNVSIGEGCVIGKGVRLRDCIILSNVSIEDFACINNSIIGWDSQIGMWSRIEGKSEDIITHKRPSITILAGDVVVHPEVMIRQCIVLPHKELKASFHDEIIM